MGFKNVGDLMIPGSYSKDAKLELFVESNEPKYEQDKLIDSSLILSLSSRKREQKLEQKSCEEVDLSKFISCKSLSKAENDSASSRCLVKTEVSSIELSNSSSTFMVKPMQN